MVSVICIVFSFIAYILFVCNHAIISEIIAYQDRFVDLGTDKNMAKVVDVTIGATVHLHCDFCINKLKLHATKWYYKQRGRNNSAIEIAKGLKIEDNNKVSVSCGNILEVRDFDRNESGIYFCKSLYRRDDYVFTYVLDGVFSKKVQPITGSINGWHEYKRTKFDIINEKFVKSQEEPFLSFRNTFSFSFRLKTLWDNWEPCKTGTRKRLGRCRLHPIKNINNYKKIRTNSNFVENLNIFYLFDNYDISCYSLTLYDTLPHISRIVKSVPEFEATETCNLDLRSKLFAEEIATEFKYNIITKQIAENGHYTLICPEVSSESELQWYKSGILLDFRYRNNMAESEEEPHITIDPTNSLYILHATKSEEGIYTCTIDGVKMQKYDIKVVSKNKILNDEFILYSIYLGFVLSLTMTCYCTGICVAWHRRTSFADPLNLHEKQNSSK